MKSASIAPDPSVSRDLSTEHNPLQISENEIIQSLKQMGLVSANNSITKKLVDIIQKLSEPQQYVSSTHTMLDTKHHARDNVTPSISVSLKPSVTLTKIAPLSDDKKNHENRVHYTSLPDTKKGSKLTLKHILGITTPNPTNINQSISLVGTQISSFLTNDDYKSLMTTSRDFQTSFKSQHQYRIEWAHKTFNSISRFDMQPPDDFKHNEGALMFYHEDTMIPFNNSRHIEQECIRNMIKCTLKAPVVTSVGVFNSIVAPIPISCQKILHWTFCPNEDGLPCKGLMSYWFSSCYLMTGGYVIKNTIQSAACLGGYAAGTAKDVCCDGLRPLDKSKHIEIPLPSVARSLFTPKTQKSAVQSPQMSRGDDRPSNRH